MRGIGPGRERLRHRLADTASKLAKAESWTANFQVPADRTALLAIWMPASPGAAAGLEGRIDLPGIVTRIIAWTPFVLWTARMGNVWTGGRCRSLGRQDDHLRLDRRLRIEMDHVLAEQADTAARDA